MSALLELIEELDNKINGELQYAVLIQPDKLRRLTKAARKMIEVLEYIATETNEDDFENQRKFDISEAEEALKE